MDRMTRDDMIAEFGGTGVENAKILDLITLDAASDAVVLVMIERRAWGESAQQLGQIEEKINRYLGYVLDGFLADQYPQYEGKPVRIRLDCAQPPTPEIERFVAAAQHAVSSHGLEFVVNVSPPPS